MSRELSDFIPGDIDLAVGFPMIDVDVDLASGLQSQVFDANQNSEEEVDLSYMHCQLGGPICQSPAQPYSLRSLLWFRSRLATLT